MQKFVKVMYGTTSGADKALKYKINEVNIANNWNPGASTGEAFGGFNYASEDCILRWLHRGNIIYDVEIPNDAENIKLEGATVIYRTNKIILTNPREIDDEVALYYYNISNIPQKSYYKALGAVSIMNYKNTALQILKDKVTKENIDEVLEEWNDFINHGGEDDRKNINETVILIEKLLKEIKSELLISRFVDKEPYIKNITSDKIINLTGESGSGKSYYTNQFKNNDDYIIIDTDEVFSRYEKSTGFNRKLGMYFRNKYTQLPNLIEDFDLIYSDILNYFKNNKETIIIDSAQYRNIKDIKLLKGKVIVLRTAINTCFERSIDRFKKNNREYTNEDLETYKQRKFKMFTWYSSLNDFILKLDNLFK